MESDPYVACAPQGRLFRRFAPQDDPPGRAPQDDPPGLLAHELQVADSVDRQREARDRTAVIANDLE